jgi:membrane protein
MSRRSIVSAAKRYGAENRGDDAAALTYFSVLSIFPAILVGTSIIGLLNQKATDALLEAVATIAPSDIMTIIEDAVARLQMNPGTAGLVALFGLAATLWAASNYVAAFSRALNEVNETGETRRWWTVLIVRVVLTIVVGALAALSGIIAATGGTLAEAIGKAVGLDDTVVTIWQWVKWPILLLLVMVIVALLYWLAPAKRTRFGERAPGAVLAVVLWIVASVGFGLYIANFGSYEKTYGALAGVIIFLVWLWITNAALLFGAEYNATAELETDEDATVEDTAGEPGAESRSGKSSNSATAPRRRP